MSELNDEMSRESQSRWSLSGTIGFASSEKEVLVNEALSGVSVKMSGVDFYTSIRTYVDGVVNQNHSLCDCVEGLDYLRQPECSEDDLRMIREWLLHGWDFSLFAHLSSLRIAYADSSDPNCRDASFPHLENAEKEHFNCSSKVELPFDELCRSLESRRTSRRFALRDSSFDLMQHISFALGEVYRCAALRQNARCVADAYRSHGLGLRVWAWLPRDQDSAPVYELPKMNSQTNLLLEREKLFEIMWKQGPARSCFGAFFLAVDFSEFTRLYKHERAFRNAAIEIGRIAQRFIVSLVSAGMGAFVTPAFIDSEVSRILELDPETVPLYFIVFGNPSEVP